jgi:hypothetical protein
MLQEIQEKMSPHSLPSWHSSGLAVDALLERQMHFEVRVDPSETLKDIKPRKKRFGRPS